MRYIITLLLTMTLLFGGEYFSGYDLLISFEELNGENIWLDVGSFAIAFTLAAMIVKIFEPIKSEVEQPK